MPEADAKPELDQSEFLAIYGLLWDRPPGEIDERALQTLEAKRYVRRGRDGWSVTYAGHMAFITRRIQQF